MLTFSLEIQMLVYVMGMNALHYHLLNYQMSTHVSKLPLSSLKILQRFSLDTEMHIRWLTALLVLCKSIKNKFSFSSMGFTPMGIRL